MLKKIITPLILVSFLTVAFFGFAAMSRGADGSMQGDCPFSVTGASLCPQDALPGAIHHLSAYQSFLNVSVDSAVVLLMSALLLAACLLILVVRPLLFRPLVQTNHFPYGPPLSARTQKIISWLSLLENSPSLV